MRAIVSEVAEVPEGSYFARFTGFTKSGDGQVVLREKTSTFEVEGETRSRTTLRIYWNFRIETGEYSGSEIPGSTPFKGVEIAEGPEGEKYPIFKAPGPTSPNFINWLATGLGNYKEALTAEDAFRQPLDRQSLLHDLEGLLLEAGEVVSLKVISGRQGPWIFWQGGVSPAPPEAIALVEEETQEASEETIQRLREVVVYVSDLLEKTEREVKRMVVREARKRFGPFEGRLTESLTQKQAMELIQYLEALEPSSEEEPGF